MSEVPSTGRRPRFFYGWVIVGIGLESFFVQLIFHALTFSVFLKPMAETLGESRSSIVVAITISSILTGVTAPVVGRLVDRYEPRAVMVGCAILAGAALAGTAAVTSVWQLYVSYGLGVGLIRLGICQLTAATAIANWFVLKRARAYAIAAAGLPLAAIILIPLTQFVVSAYGWREGWLALAAVVWGMLVIPPAVFLRNRPEDVGELPDGVGSSTANVGAAPTVGRAVRGRPYASGEDWTAGEALKSAAFWLVLMMMTLHVFTNMSMTAHMVPYFTDRGMSEAVAAGAIIAWGVASLLAKAFWGYIVEGHDIRRGLQIMAFGMGVGVILTMPASTVWGTFLVSIVLGWASGGMMQQFSQVWPDYFGRSSQGTIRGWAGLFMEFAAATGPLLAAWVYDVRGSYQMAFAVFAAASLLGAVLVSFAPPPFSRQALSAAGAITLRSTDSGR